MSSDSSFPRPPKRRLEDRTDSDPAAIRVAGQADDDEASRSSERPLPLRRKKAEIGQVVEFPRPVSAKRRRAEAPAPKDAEPAPEPVDPTVRPTYLASELLRQDWFPRAPLARTLRWGALGLGTIGALGTIALGGTGLGPLVLASLLACAAVAGVVPIKPEQRGVALAVLGLAGAGFAGWWRMAHDPAAPLLAFSVILTASALLFRAAHRTSRMARVLVGIGLATIAAWLVLTGGLDALVVESFAWQHAVGPAARAMLGLVIVAGVLTFLDPNGHGGAWIVGAASIAWLGLDVTATMATGAWPVGGGAGETVGSRDWIATFAQPFVATLAAGGLCQVWVLTSRPAQQAAAQSE